MPWEWAARTVMVRREVLGQLTAGRTTGCIDGRSGGMKTTPDCEGDSAWTDSASMI
jgi:hypothetical protein